MDSRTTNTILEENIYFWSIRNSSKKVMTITSSDKCTVDSGRVTDILHMRTILHIVEALLYPEFTRNLLNFKDIHANSFHVETDEEDGKEHLLITKRDSEIRILKKTFLYEQCLVLHCIKSHKVFTNLKIVFCSAELFSL